MANTPETIAVENGTNTSQGHFTAEGPVWDSKRKVFFYTDIEAGTLHQFNPGDGKTTTWQIGQRGEGDKNGQMIGGTTAVNSDGSLILMLEGGSKAGVNYFRPETGELVHVQNSWPETDKPSNRPNDSTVINIDGKNRMVFGTMSKQWEKGLEEGKKDGAYYILNDHLQPQKLTIDQPYPGTVISNGLADGGRNPDGTANLFWAETVGPDSELKVWRGKLNSDRKVTNVKVFADYLAIAGEREGRPDGANMIEVNGKPAYAVAALHTGEIRAFDPMTGESVAHIKLPDGITNVTKFAVGEDGSGKPAMFVTTINHDYPKNKEGINGSTFLLPLPLNIALHPASAQVTDYPPMEQVKARQVPGVDVDLAQAFTIEPVTSHVRMK